MEMEMKNSEFDLKNGMSKTPIDHSVNGSRTKVASKSHSTKKAPFLYWSYAENWAPEYGNVVLSKWSIKRSKVQKLITLLEQPDNSITRCSLLNRKHFGFAICISHSETTMARMLVGNKCDLDNIRAVSVEDGKNLAEKQGLFFMETSALDSTNVKTAFEMVIKDIYNNAYIQELESSRIKLTHPELELKRARQQVELRVWKILYADVLQRNEDGNILKGTTLFLLRVITSFYILKAISMGGSNMYNHCFGVSIFGMTRGEE
uniref:Ras-related protein RABA5c-like n=1 Tax=Tanacetum cinerariifolium TaxID=118510 RepID=A0A699I1Q8_TANCI|nr:Ras-related protein RABA5c-like [Tanacetum cinerariifolium]